MSIVTVPGLAPLPPCVAHFPTFKSAVLFDIGRKIHTAWHGRESSSADGTGKEDSLTKSTTLPKKDDPQPFLTFMSELVRLPTSLAAAFGFKSAVLVFDHFDATAYDIEPGDHFPTSTIPVNLFSVLCQAIQGVPYFVSSLDDEDLLKLFRAQKITEYRLLSTERLIDRKGERELVAPQLQICITLDMCRGCPAYVAAFDNVCDLAADAQEKAAVKSQFSRLKSVVDISRNGILKQEFVRLCLTLASADTLGLFDEDKMNTMVSIPDFVVRVRETGQKDEK
jgi:hypothetical protein